MIIDMHTHAFPDKLAPKAIATLRAASRTKPFTDGTVGGLCASMGEARIDLSVVLPVATAARQVPTILDTAIRLRETESQTGVTSFGGIHPDDEHWEADLQRIASAGLRGVKLHPPYQDVDFDDIRYLRILERAGELGLIVVTHAGLDVGVPDDCSAAPEKIRRALHSVGPVRLICAHMGGWRCWQEACELLADTNVYLDTAFALGAMTPDDGVTAPNAELQMLTDEAFLDMVRLFGADRILFGTDSPWGNQSADAARILALPLDEESKQKIMGENAARLLGLLP